jgi:hypothetical protein
MQNTNVREYEQIKSELDSVDRSISKCNSLTVVVCAAGCVFLIFSKLSLHSLLASASGAFVICIFLGTMYYIMISKFVVHNKFAGYLDLLSMEIRHDKIKNKNTVSRCSSECSKNSENLYSSSRQFWTSTLVFTFLKEGRKVDPWNNKKNRAELIRLWRNYRLHDPLTDRNKFFKGISLLFMKIGNCNTSKRYYYPYQVSYFILFNLLVFSASGFWYYFRQFHVSGFDFANAENLLLTFIVFFTVCLLAILLQKTVSNFHSLINGSKTVQAFCWSFFQFRIEYLNNIGIKPSYIAPEFSVVGDEDPSSATTVR